MMMPQTRNQQIQMQQFQQPYAQSVNPYPYLANHQPIQMGRPCQPMERMQRVYQPSASPQMRERANGNYVRPQPQVIPQPQPQIPNQYVEAQIRYHEN